MLINNTIKRLYILTVSFALFVSWGCSRHSETKEKVILKLHQSKDKINDTIFYSSIYSIEEHNDLFYLSDYDNNRILVLNKNLDLNKIIGHSGKGPGEFKGVTTIRFIGDTIVAFDDRNRRINLYDLEGNVYGSYSIPINRVGFNRLAVDNKINIYYTNNYNKKLIVKVNPYEGIIKRFGEKHASILFPVDSLHTQGHLNSTERGEILYVSFYEPLIEKYSSSGSLIQRKDISLFIDEEVLEKLRTFNTENYKNTGAKSGLFPDAYYKNNKLYVLGLSNKVFEFNVYPTISFNRILFLGENRENKNFLKICVYKNSIVTVNIRNQKIQEYRFPN